MIQVENLSKYFNGFCAVDQINLEIKKGEILGLLGPNGAGKTTTLRMLTGYLLPTAGTIRIDNYSIQSNPLEIKQMIGYLPEFAPLYPNMLVYDFIDYIARVRGLPEADKAQRIRQIARLCGLREIMHQSIGELSRGLKQRVGLAQAMINNPEILILDEPTSGLDPNQRLEIKEIIKRIGKEKTVVLSTHILSEAEATCDRIVIIDKGQIVADDCTANLKQSLAQEHIVHLSLQNAVWEEVRERLTQVTGVAAVGLKDSSAENGVLSIELHCSVVEDLRPAIYQSIKATDWILIEFQQETKTLEKIFRELTKER